MQKILQDFTSYLKDHGLSKNTIRNYLVDLSRFIEYFQQLTGKIFNREDFKKASINDKVFINYFSYLKEKNIPQSTQRRYYATLKRFVEWNNPTIVAPVTATIAPISTTPDTDSVILPVQEFVREPVLEKKSRHRWRFPQVSSLHVLSGLTALFLFLVGAGAFAIVNPDTRNYFSNLLLNSNNNKLATNNNKNISSNSVAASVLGERTTESLLEINTDTRINGLLEALEGINTEGADIDASTGSVFASNLLYDLVAGTGISIGGVAQTPTITNTDPGSAQNMFKNIAVGSTTITASENADTLTFKAGSNVSLAVSGDQITISSTDTTGSSFSSWTFAVNGTEQDTVTSGDVLDFTSGSDIDLTRSADDQITVALEPVIDSVTALNLPAGGTITGTNATIAFTNFTVGSSGAVTGATLSDGTTTFADSTWTSTAAIGWDLATSQTALNIESGLFNIDTTNSRIGIGNTSPLSLLSVGAGQGFQVDGSGDLIRIKGLTYSWPTAHSPAAFLRDDGSGNLTWSTIGGAGGVEGVGTVGYLTKWGSTTQIVNSQLFEDTTTGRIGVGTSAPAYTLDLASTGAIRAGSYVLGSDAINDFTGAGLKISSGALSLNLLNAQIGIGATGSFSGLELLNNQLTLLQGCSTGQILKWNDSNGSWECASDQSGAQSAVVNIENNDVGVGASVGTLDFSSLFSVTASPVDEVNITIAPDVLNFTELSDNLVLDASTGINLYTGSGNANLRLFNGNTGGELLFADGTNSLIGIGTTAPGKALEVASTSHQLRLSNTLTAITDFFTNAAGELGILPSGGNVGIGTTDPSYRLDVTSAGAIRAGSYVLGSDLLTDFTGSGLTVNNGALTVSSVEDLASSLPAGSVIFSDGSSLAGAAGNFYWDQSNRRLGIGMSSPTQTLDIARQFVVDTTNNRVGIGNTSPTSLLSVGAGQTLRVNGDGDLVAGFTQLDGSTTTTASSTGNSITVASTSNFNAGNYIRIVNGSSNCGPGTTTCYAKITSVGASSMLLNASFTVDNAAAITEFHLPELGADNLTSTLTNRYGRGYFIAGVITGNGSTTLDDGQLYTSNTTSENSQSLSITTGRTTTSGNSGNLTLDTGFAAGTAGTINIGTTAASSITIGRSGISTTVAGNLILNGQTFSDLAGAGLTTVANALTLDLQSSALGVGSTASYSGMQLTSTNQLSLLQGCSNGQVLGWDSGNSWWECTTTSSGLAGSGTDNRLARWDSLGTGLENGGILDLGSSVALTIDALNNVGIGTTAPGKALEVLSTSHQLRLSNTLTAVTDFFTTSLGYLGILPTGGRVGIGTTAPSYTLDVTSTGAVRAGSYVLGSDVISDFTGSGLTNNGGALTVANIENLTTALPAGGVIFSNGSNLTSASGNFFWDATNTRLGIGTSAPVRTFQVAGTSEQLRIANGTNWSDFFTTTSGYLGINTSGGRVGIGTTAPSYTLDLTSTGALRAGSYVLGSDAVNDFTGVGLKIASGALTIDQSALSVEGFTTSVPSGSVIFSNGSTLAGAAGNFFWNQTLGRLGIGTSAPTSTLSVAGNAVIGSGYIGLGVTGPSNGLIVQGNVGIGNTNPTSALSIGQNQGFQVSSAGDITSIKGLTYSFPTSHTAAGFLRDDGSGNLTWTTIGGAGGVEGSGAAGYLTKWLTSSSIANSMLFEDFANQRIGVGTSAPAYTFDISSTGALRAGSYVLGSDLITDFTGTGLAVNNGALSLNLLTSAFVGAGSTASVSGLELANNQLALLQGCGDNEILQWNESASSWECQGIGAAGALDASGTPAAGQAAFFTDNNTLAGMYDFFWDQTNRRLGIGTSAPTRNLSVQGTNPQLRLAYDQNAWTDLFTNSAGELGIAPTGGNVGIGTTNPTTMFDIAQLFNVTSTGQVGIGTTSPLSALSVGPASNFQVSSAGDITRIKDLTYSWPTSHTSAGFLRDDGSGNLTWTTIGGAGGVSGVGTTGYLTKWLDATTIANSLIFENSSNQRIGIGTSAPTQYFDVAGKLVVDTTNNRVGIGTTSPNYTLDVFGSTNTNSLYLSGTQVTSSANELNYLTQSTVVNGGLYFGNGTKLTQAAGTLFYDQTNRRLGVGSSAPSYTLDITSGGAVRAGSYVLGSDVVTDFTGSGLAIRQGTLSLDLLTSALGVGSTASVSGLELVNNQLALLQGCSSGQILKWNESASTWECSSDTTGASSAIIDIQNNDVGVGSSITTVDFSSLFSITESPAFEANITIAADALNFTELSDNLVLDSSTSLNFYNGSTVADLRMFNGNTNSDLFFFDGTNRRFGIGTSAPAYTLDVTSTGAVRSGSYVLGSDLLTDFTGTGLSVQNGALTVNQSALNVEGFATTLPAGAIPFSNGSTLAAQAGNLFFNSSNSRLGVGTSTPSQTFDVARKFVVDTTNTRVGIGTTSPNYTLDVVGSTNTTSLYLTGTQVTSTANELNYLSGSTVVNGGLYFGNGTKLTQASGTLFYDQTNLRLGIGTSSPTYALDVTSTGAVRAGSYVLGSDTVTDFTGSGLTNNGGALTVASIENLLTNLANGGIIYSNGTNLTSAAGSFFWDATNRRLGIGTSTPSYALDVTSTGAILAGSYVLGSDAVNDFTGNGLTITSGALSLNLATSVGTGSTASVSGLQFANGQVGMLQGCSNNQVLGWDSANGWWECMTTSSGLNGSGTDNRLARWDSLGTGLENGGILDLGSQVALTIDALHNVGIGTTAPGKALEVASTSHQLRLSNTLTAITDFFTNASGYLGILPSGGRVGIGTTAPSYTLDVTSTGAVRAGSYVLGSDLLTDFTGAGLLVANGALTVNQSALSVEGFTTSLPAGGVIFSNGSRLTSAAGSFFWEESARRLGVGMSAPTQAFDVARTFVVDTANGRVGIGTTSPLYTLDVTGSIKGGSLLLSSNNIGTLSDTDLLSFADNALTVNGSVTVGTLGAGATDTVVTQSGGTLQTRTIDTRVWGSTLIDGSGNANLVARFSDANTLTTGALFDNGTRVGVGATGASTLSIAGNTTIGSTYVGMGVSAPTNGLIVEGRVGIGTTLPQYTLDLNTIGAIRAGSYVLGSDLITDFTGSGLTVNNGALTATGLANLSSLPAGSVIFSDGTNLTGAAGNFFWDQTNSRIGIGTSSPTRSFSVLSTTPQARLSYDGSNWTDLFTNASGNLGIVPVGGQVGIGTTAPSYTLDVTSAGAVRAGSYVLGSDLLSDFTGAGLSVNNGALTVSNIENLITALPNGGVTFSNGTNLTSAAGNFFWDAANGRLGVGTSSPSYTLDTTSTGSIRSGSFVLGSDIVTDFTGNGLTASAGSLAINLASSVGTGSTASVSGLEIVNGQLSVLQGCSNAQVLGWDSGNGFWECMTTSSGLGGSGTDNRLARWDASGTGLENGGILDLGSTVALTIDASNRIGIGTTAPSYTLDITSTGAVRAGSYVLGSDLITDFTGSGLSVQNGALTANGLANFSSLAAGSVIFSDGTNLAGQAGNFYFDQTNSRLGIGTSAPVRTLSLLSTAPQARLSYDTNNWTDLFTNSSGELGIIPIAGNVGIGTTNPATNLHVMGTIRSDGGSGNQYLEMLGTGAGGTIRTSSGGITLAPGGVTEASIEAAGISLAADNRLYTSENFLEMFNSGNGGITLGSTHANYNINLVTNNINRLRITNTGLIGIGTTAPVRKLELADTSEQLRLSNGANWSDFFTSTNGYLGLTTSGGRVGISTTAPSYTLDVTSTGAVRAGSYVLGSDLITDFTGSGLSVQNGALTATGLANLSSLPAGSVIFSDGTNLAGQAGNFYFDSTNSRLGIGTSAPTSTLAVAGNAIIGSQYVGFGTTAPSNGLLVQGTVGIGTTSPTQAFDVARQFVVDTTNGRVGIGTTSPTGKLDIFNTTNTSALNITADNISTGIGINTSFDGLTTGTGLSINSTSTALTSGGLTSIDWSPVSSTIATGDLFKINIGTNGTVGNLFAIYDNNSPVFTVSENGIESAVPHAFTATGDVSIAYDLNFTNGTASNIKFQGPGYIMTDNASGNYDLTLSAANAGAINIADSAIIGTGIGDSLTIKAGSLALSNASLLNLADSSITSLNIEGGLMNFDTTNRRIGIGTTAPSYTLDLTTSGAVRAGSYVLGSDVITDFTGTGLSVQNGTLTATGLANLSSLPGGSVIFSDGTNLTGAAGNFYWNQSLGRLGIGTSAPTSTLSVAGNTIVGSTYIGMGVTAPTNGLIVEGRVGIGTTNPAYTLDVNTFGSVRAGSYVLGSDIITDFTGSGLSIVNGALTATAGNVNVEALLTSLPAGAITYSDGSTLSSQAGNFFWDATNSRLGIGTSSPTRSLSVLSTSPQTRLSYDGSNWTDLFTNSAGELGIVSTSGNVGIGTTDPSYTLDLTTSGAVRAGSYVLGSDIITDFTGSGLSIVNGALTASGASSLEALTTTLPAGGIVYSNGSNPTAAAGTFYWDAANTRLGVGTSAPGKALDILSTSHQLRLSNTTTALTDLFTNSAGELGIVASGGNVGIGTTDPTAGLDVAGTAWLRGANTTVAQGLYVNSSGNVGIGYTSPRQMFDVNGKFVVDNVNSRVGIGTTSPTASLDIFSTSTATALNLTGDNITTGTGINTSFDGLTTGAGLNLSSTSTSLTTGTIASVDWSPASSTTATSDLFKINIGANATIGNLLAIYDNGSALFTVSETGIESALPHAFTASGDVSIAYDLVFTNQTTSNIQSYGPLTIASGEAFESNNLTLQTYNSGNVYMDLGGYGNLAVDSGVKIGSTYAGIGVTAPANGLIVEGNVGIGTSSPNVALSVTGRIRQSVWTADGDTAVYKDDPTGNIGVQASDARLKKNLELISNPLGKIMGLNGYLHNMTDEPDGSKKRLGVIAQDVLNVGLPEATFNLTSENGDSYFGVHYEKLTALLIEGIKAQQGQINSLSQTTSSMQGAPNPLAAQVASLDSRVLSLESVLDTQTTDSAFMETLTTLTSLPAQHIVSSLDNENVSLATIADRDGIVGISTAETTENTETSIQRAGTAVVVATDENGPIKRGDPITVSSVKDGFGTRAVTDGMIVGFALEDAVYNATESATLENPSDELAQDGENASGSGEATESGEIVEEPATSELQTGHVKVALSVLWNGQASTVEDLMADSTSLELTDEMVTFDQPVAIYNDLHVLGHTIVDSISATGQIRAGLLTIDGIDNSINTIGEPLRLQNHFASGDIDMFDGKVLMTTNGDIKTVGEVTAKKYNVDAEDVAGASAGSIVIPAGENFTIVETTALTPNSLIFVTPNRAEAVGSYKHDETTIVIELKEPLTEDLEVNWWIIN